MQLVKCIVRPDKVIDIKDALEKINVPGLTVIESRGHGQQKGHTAMYRGKEYFVSLLPKMMIEIVVPDDQVDAVVRTVTNVARTGQIGDGRIFVLPVTQSFKIRTGERDA